jgi:hypothetical protein
MSVALGVGGGPQAARSSSRMRVTKAINIGLCGLGAFFIGFLVRDYVFLG